MTLKIGGTFEAQQHPPYEQEHHHIAPTTAGWKSPVPYLFGGLAAMLGLIAFALLILACSYWKLSGYLDAGEDTGEFNDDGKPKDVANDVTTSPNSILVIMAGEENPTFLATPATSTSTSTSTSSSRASSFQDSNRSKASISDGGEKRVDDLETTTMTSTSTAVDEEKS